MNALAVTSFVLSIVWVAGVGSLLAVIFGIIALVAISRARGAQRGRGWAIAGLIIGGLGLVLTIALGVLISHALVAKTYPYGTPVTTDSSVTGFTNVTVFGIATGIPLTQVSTNSTNSAGSYTVADVRVCVGSGGMPKVHEHLEFFLLRLSGGGLLPSVDPGLVARGPALWQSGVSWLPNQCHRGFLTFVVPQGETPDGVRYNGNILDPIQWTASGT